MASDRLKKPWPLSRCHHILFVVSGLYTTRGGATREIGQSGIPRDVLIPFYPSLSNIWRQLGLGAIEKRLFFKGDMNGN